MLKLYSRELWEGFNPPFIKEVMPKRKRRMTKGRLVEIYRKGGSSMSPVIDTEVREGADDVTEGILYEIVNVEDLTTDVQGLKGIRVSLKTAKDVEGNVMLWKRRVTGTGSKLGVFITHLGNNTDKWLHKWVIFKVWQDRKRELEVIPAPTPKLAKVKKAATT